MRFLLAFLALSIQTLTSWGQEISVVQNRVQIPVLKSPSHGPVLQFRIDTHVKLHATEITVEFEGTTDIQKIDSVFLFDLEKDSIWSTDMTKIIAQRVLVGEQAVFTFSPGLSVYEK